MNILLNREVYFSSPVTGINYLVAGFDTEEKEYTLVDIKTCDKVKTKDPLSPLRLSFSAFEPRFDKFDEEDTECIAYMLNEGIDHFTYISGVHRIAPGRKTA